MEFDFNAIISKVAKQPLQGPSVALWDLLPRTMDDAITRETWSQFISWLVKLFIPYDPPTLASHIKTWAINDWNRMFGMHTNELSFLSFVGAMLQLADILHRNGDDTTLSRVLTQLYNCIHDRSAINHDPKFGVSGAWLNSHVNIHVETAQPATLRDDDKIATNFAKQEDSNSLFNILAAASHDGGLSAWPGADNILPGSDEDVVAKLSGYVSQMEKLNDFYAPTHAKHPKNGENTSSPGAQHLKYDRSELFSDLTSEQRHLQDHADSVDPDEDLFAFAGEERSAPLRIALLGPKGSGKTTVAARLAYILDASYIEPSTLLRSCAVAYLADVQAAKQQLAYIVKQRAEAAEAKAKAGSDGSDDSDDIQTASSDAQVDKPLPSVDDLLRLNAFTTVGKAVGAAISDALAGHGVDIPSLTQKTLDVRNLVAPQLVVTAVVNALVDSWLHDRSYVLDGWFNEAELANIQQELMNVGEDAKVAHKLLERACARLFVDAAAGREEASNAPSSARPPSEEAESTTGKDTARSGSHVRFAEGTKGSEAVETRGGKGIAKPKVGFADDVGKDEEPEPGYDHVKPALDAARLQIKMTQKLWNARQKRAVLLMAISNVKRLTQLADPAVVAALLPRTFVTLHISAQELQFRATRTQTYHAHTVGLSVAPAVVRDVIVKEVETEDGVIEDPEISKGSDAQIRLMADSDLALRSEDAESSEDTLGGPALPTGLRAGRIFLHVANGLPSAVASPSTNYQFAEDAYNYVPNSISAQLSADGAPERPAGSSSAVNAEQPVDDVFREVVCVLGGPSAFPFAGGDLAAQICRPRWLKLPEELNVQADPVKGDAYVDGEDKDSERHRYLLKEAVPQISDVPLVVAGLAAKVRSLPPKEPVDAHPDSNAGEQSNTDTTEHGISEHNAPKLEGDHDGEQAGDAETGDDNDAVKLAEGDQSENNATNEVGDVEAASEEVAPTVKIIRKFDYGFSVSSTVFQLATPQLGDRIFSSRPSVLQQQLRAVAAEEQDGEVASEETLFARDGAMASLVEGMDAQATKARANGGSHPLAKAVNDRSEVVIQMPASVSRRWSVLGRHCPVTLVEEGIAAKGRLCFVVEYRGFLFALADTYKMQLFLQRPRYYLSACRHLTLDPRILLLTPPGNQRTSAYAKQVATDLATRYDVPLVDIHEVIERKLACYASGAAAKGSLGSDIAEALERGQKLPSRLVARIVQSEIARLRAVATLGADSPHEPWDKVPDPEVVMKQAAAAEQIEKDAAELEVAIRVITEAAAKKRTPAKKLDEMVHKEKEKILNSQNVRNEKAANLEKSKMEHDSDDEMDLPDDAGSSSSSDAASAAMTMTARAFDIAPTQAELSRTLVPLLTDVDSTSNRLRYHHVCDGELLASQGWRCSILTGIFDAWAEGDDDGASGMKDKFLSAVFHLSRVDLCTGSLLGALNGFDSQQWHGSLSYSVPALSELAAPHLLSDDVITPFAHQISELVNHAALNEASTDASWPLGLLGQDAAFVSNRILQQSATMRHVLPPVTNRSAVGWVLYGVPYSLGVLKHLASHGIVPQTILTVELHGDEEEDEDAENALDPSMRAAVADRQLNADVFHETDQSTWAATCNVSPRPYQQRAKLRIGNVQRFSQRHGIRMRRLQCAGGNDAGVTLSQTEPRMLPAANYQELWDFAVQAVDPFAPRVDDADDDLPVLDDDGGNVMAWSGKYCPVVLLRDNKFVLGRSDDPFRLRYRGQTVLLSDLAAVQALRARPGSHLGSIGRMGHAPEMHREVLVSIMLLAPSDSQLSEVAHLCQRISSKFDVIHLPHIFSHAEIEWRKTLPPPPPRPDAEEEDIGEPETEVVMPPASIFTTALSNAVAASVSRGKHQLWLAENWDPSEELLNEMQAQKLLPMYACVLDVLPEELIEPQLVKLRAAQNAEGEDPTAEDALTAVQEITVKIDTLAQTLEGFGVSTVPKLRWHGLRNRRRLGDKLIHNVLPLFINEPITSQFSQSTVLPDDMFSAACICPASYVLDGLQSGSLRLSRYGSYCPVSLYDSLCLNAAIATQPEVLCPPDYISMEAAKPTTAEEQMDADSDEQVEGAEKQKPRNLSIPVLVVIGPIVFVCSTIEHAWRFVRNPRLFTSAVPPISMTSLPHSYAAIGRQEDVEAGALTISNSLGSVLVEVNGSVTYVLDRLSESRLHQQIMSALLSGQQLGAAALVACAAARAKSAECRMRGFVLVGVPQTVEQAALLVASGVFPDHFLMCNPNGQRITKQTGRTVFSAIDPLRTTEEDAYNPESDEKKVVEVAFSEDAAIDGRVQSAHMALLAPPSRGDTAALYAALSSLGVDVLWLDRAFDWEVSQGIIANSRYRAAQARRFAYNVCHGRASQLGGLSCRPNLSSTACPVSWNARRQILITKDPLLIRKLGVVFRGRFYVCSNAVAVRTLCSQPLRSLGAAHSLAPQIPAHRVSPQGCTDHAEDDLQLRGLCPVCLRAVGTNILPSYAHTGLLLRKGERMIIAVIDGLPYSCCSESHAQAVLRAPRYYMGQATPAIAPVLRDVDTASHQSAQDTIHDLFNKAGATLDYTGYLENSTLPALSQALRALDTARSTMPTTVSLKFIALYLKAHNPGMKPHLRARHRKSLHVYLGDTTEANEHVSEHLIDVEASRPTSPMLEGKSDTSAR